jgi:F-type H+-transporting ATPase subunit delta
MSKRTAQQARTLFDIADEASQAERVAGELEWCAQVLRMPDVTRTLLNPVVPPDKKVEIVGALADAASLSPMSAKLLAILATHDRLGDVEEMSSAFRQRLRERQNIVSAEVTTAVPLPSGAAQAIARRLSDVSGKQVEVGSRVDPSIIGGVVARIGSTVYDGSVSGQLTRMRQKLVESV